MRIVVVLVFFINVLFAISTTEKIKKETKNLNTTSKMEKKIHDKLNNIVKDILKGEGNLKYIDNQITSLNSQIKDLQTDSKTMKLRLKNLTEQNQNLVKSKKQLEEKIINIIADKFSFYVITDKQYQESVESIIGDEVLKKMDAILKKDFLELSKAYENTNETINKHNKEMNDVQNSLKELEKKQNSLNLLKKTREKNVNILKQQKQKYKLQLDKIQDQRKELAKTLQSLKIIKKEEENKKVTKSKTTTNIRQVGSSYQTSRVKKYKGTKTIAPLDNFVVKQEFGNYVDPIYNIKIFNEAVILRSTSQNAKVKNVLNGKVIFAKDTAMLDKVIIIEHALGIHTIYAHLKQIAPTIKVGKKVKKGYVIGRVEDDLSFEVTQKNYHINPLELIKH